MPPKTRSRTRKTASRTRPATRARKAGSRAATRTRTAASRASKTARKTGRTAAKRSTTTARASTGRIATRSRKQDAIALLKQDHKEVKDLFRRYRALGPRAGKSKRRIADTVIRELSIHAAIEEQFLYPTIRDNVQGGQALFEEALREHQTAKETLQELLRLAPDDAEFDTSMRSLMREVEHHVKEEETELFPKLRRAVDRDTLVSMGEMMRNGKKTAPTRPHPRSPSSPPANMVVGLAAGAIDRVRDVGRNLLDR
jgi:hemerythrin superfamily protein